MPCNMSCIQEVMTGRCIHTLAGHRGEISSCQFNWTGELCISVSLEEEEEEEEEEEPP